MTDEWTTHRLADLCDSIDYGYTASAIEAAVGPKFLRITDIVGQCIDWNSVPHCEISEDQIGQYRIHDGDIVIARTGATTGFSAFITNPPNAIFASYLVRLKIGKKAESRFISYFLKSKEFWNYLNGVLGDKSAQPNASAKTMTQVTLKLPPLSDQKKISYILGTFDDRIELNRQMNDTLEAMARAIFKSWFIYFDPVYAKAEGRQPIGMDSATANLFPDSFEYSELGKIPKGWKAGNGLDLFEISREALNPANFSDEIFHHYSIPAFDEGKWPKPEAGNLIKSNKFVIDAKVVLVSKLNPRIPRIWLPIIDEKFRAICSTEFIVTKPKKDIGREFLYCYFLSEDFLSRFETMVTGTSGSHQRVKPEYLESMETLVPKTSIIKAFADITKPILEKIMANLAQCQILSAIRDALLPKLLSGEIKVKQCEVI